MSEKPAVYEVDKWVFAIPRAKAVMIGVDVSTTGLGLAAVEVGGYTLVTTDTWSAVAMVNGHLYPILLGKERGGDKAAGTAKRPKLGRAQAKAVSPQVILVKGRKVPELARQLQIPGRYLTSRQVQLPKRQEGESEAEHFAHVMLTIVDEITLFVAIVQAEYGDVVGISIEQPARGGWGSKGDRAGGNGAAALQAVGAAQAAAGRLRRDEGHAVYGPYPQETKKVLAGHGWAVKAQMKKVAAAYAGKLKIGEDEADSVAAAVWAVDEYGREAAV